MARAIFDLLPPPRTAHHGDYRDRDGKIVDDVLTTFFTAPHSYTGEDVLEISSHGNPFIAQKILEDLLSRGCRSAEAGEFTKRAFLNGRIDLSQAEAVMDLIHARSERALEAANHQLRGSLGRQLEKLTDELLSTLARVEAYIDFPDEDLPAEDRAIVHRAAERVRTHTERLLATQHYGELLRDGLKTVILGEPNAGKSSLLNRLVGRDRALVSAEPGTTRDFLEERIQKADPPLPCFAVFFALSALLSWRSSPFREDSPGTIGRKTARTIGFLNTNYANKRQFRSIDQNGNSLSEETQSSGSSDTERTKSEPHEIQSCRTLKRRPDMKLPASLCSLRYLPFNFCGLIFLSDNWRLLA